LRRQGRETVRPASGPFDRHVKTGANQPSIHQLQDVLTGVESHDRTTINAWEDEQFLRAVKATGRKKLIMTALWTDACLTFPALDALKEGIRSLSCCRCRGRHLG
jgi:nicotinamidase-related amidase